MSQQASEEPLANPEGTSWRLIYTKQAQKDAKKLASSNLKEKAEELLAVLKENPFQNPPPYEKLVGDLSGAYSRRINIQHRLVYEVIESEQVVKIIRMWTHYE
ncbi:Txe/YoeB family addiction module toxin [Nostoc cf. edaphicum LEGE 07299]|uniref:Endoribonuclease YoeB n=1 Tax=Nostoc cf. edaphicum LEGE 07299 TaxID=2777974 RepID=A0ABR9TWU2_9NOSO|nr:Txe/YoeB family addiction module toxin [Nostoc edaphicum]MBE9104888.1 Txe/YoeB family addiction module toxin [Nostoc cf. edaphicum LEGE 07299]